MQRAYFLCFRFIARYNPASVFVSGVRILRALLSGQVKAGDLYPGARFN